MNRYCLFAVTAIGFLAACAFVTPASAQNAIQGHFTMSHEVRWQNANLPAGDYSFKAASRTSPMIVTGPNGSVFELASVIGDKSQGPSLLSQWFVI
jgi:hypothetical protein